MLMEAVMAARNPKPEYRNPKESRNPNTES
jgi:hypothetical protein